MDECVRSWWWQPYLERQDSTALRAHWLDLARLVGGKKDRCAQDGEESSITSCNETDRSTPTTTTNPSQSRPFCAN